MTGNSSGSTAISLVQAAVVVWIVTAATAGLLTDHLSETTWLGIVGPIAGLVLGVHAAGAGARQEAEREAKRNGGNA